MNDILIEELWRLSNVEKVKRKLLVKMMIEEGDESEVGWERVLSRFEEEMKVFEYEFEWYNEEMNDCSECDEVRKAINNNINIDIIS